MGSDDVTTSERPLVRVERRGPATVLTLDRPDALNAFTLAMVDELRHAVQAATADPDVIGTVITGAGRGFCAGLDAGALAATTSGAAAGDGRRDAPVDGELAGLFSFLVEQPKPVIGAINGVAAGGGFVLAAKCDLRFAAESATFVTIFSKRGLIAEHGMTWLLPRQLGVGAALDLLWSSRKVDATEALRLGLVQRVVPDDAVVDTAVRYLTDLSEQVSPSSMADTKRLVYGQLGADMDAAFAEADDATWRGVQRRDATEGANAYLERRPPRFDPIGEVAT